MEEGEGGIRLSKRFSDKDGGGEVDYKTKAGTAWSHSFLNQKPWHPLSYPNQRRKWIAEQTHAHRDRRADELAREYVQEQEFLRQTSLLSQKDKEKVDIMQAVSFMYVRPPGYNAESAKAAEITDERKKLGENDPTVASSSVAQEAAPVKEEKKKSRPKDVFGRTLPTEEEFAVLKNAPRLETGVAGCAKPFAVEVRNVKCIRCGTFGHQSGDRDCPLKDAIMPNDENRLKRDDPLTAIMAHMDSSEPLKWELKQRPGISPPRGGFMADDPNQQIVAEEIFDEYGGFLSGGGIPELLANFPSTQHKRKKSKSKSKRKRRGSSRKSDDDDKSSSDSDVDIDLKRGSKPRSKSKGKHKKQASQTHFVQEGFNSENDRHRRRARREETSHNSKRSKNCWHSSASEDSQSEKRHVKRLASSSMWCCEENHSTCDSDRRRRRSKPKEKYLSYSGSSEDLERGRSRRKSRYKHSGQIEHQDSDKLRRKNSSPGRWDPCASHTHGSNYSERKSTRKEETHRSHKKTGDD